MMKIAALASVLSSVTAFAPQSTTGRTSTAVNAGLNGWVPDENVSVDYTTVHVYNILCTVNNFALFTSPFYFSFFFFLVIVLHLQEFAWGLPGSIAPIENFDPLGLADGTPLSK